MLSLNIATSLSSELWFTLFVTFPLSLSLSPAISSTLTFLSDAASLTLMTVEREEESHRSYLRSASRPQRRVCGNRWYTSVMCLGSRELAGGEEWRKNTQAIDMATLSDCVWLQICQ